MAKLVLNPPLAQTSSGGIDNAGQALQARHGYKARQREGFKGLKKPR